MYICTYICREQERHRIIQNIKVSYHFNSASKMILYHFNIKIINENEMRKR